MKLVVLLGALALVSTPALSQDLAPVTWHDDATGCTYFKVGDTLSLRYRRDGSPDCASAPPNTRITRDDLERLTRSVGDLRWDNVLARRRLDVFRHEVLYGR